MRKFIIGLRTSIKVIALFVVSLIIILTIAMCVYKPIYSVTLNGEMIGYCENKATLQAKILEYIENGDEDNVAFVQIDDMPTYSLCFLKRGIETNDDEIYEKVISAGITYYKYYAIAVSNEEKLYVSTFEEAESVVSGLKEKESNNVDDLSIVEKYVTDKCEVTDTETAISSLYEEKKTTTTVVATTTTVTSAKVGSGYKEIGISFIKPVNGTVSSRFGYRWGTTHKGTDYAAATGTSIYAAASGTVTYAGWSGSSYGYLVIISHGNGVQTYYAHCSSVLTTVGATVSQGDLIAKVGSTGNATGPHLHFEIRVDGVAYNAEYYV